MIVIMIDELILNDELKIYLFGYYERKILNRINIQSNNLDDLLIKEENKLFNKMLYILPLDIISKISIDKIINDEVSVLDCSTNDIESNLNNSDSSISNNSNDFDESDECIIEEKEYTKTLRPGS